mmetsp:Transcript_55327/g.161486  ORF Transcript_55327/g.161486 Transcript_55327/m.161486 type:complete len:268 (-) Transcript_55327:46-849(-)
MHCLQGQSLPQRSEVFSLRASRQRQALAVHARERRPVPRAVAVSLKREGEGVAIHQAHINGVPAGCVGRGEGRLKLAVNGWRAMAVVVGDARTTDHARLTWATAVSNRAVVAGRVAAHLRPEAGGDKAAPVVGGEEVVRTSRRDLHVLRRGPHAARRDVGDPHGLVGAAVDDPKPLLRASRAVGAHSLLRRRLREEPGGSLRGGLRTIAAELHRIERALALCSGSLALVVLRQRLGRHLRHGVPSLNQGGGHEEGRPSQSQHGWAAG